jgi:hypothetical protein
MERRHSDIKILNQMNNIIIPFRANLLESGTPPFANISSLSFDGVDDYLNVGTALNLGTDSTISFWIKRGRVTTAEVFLSEDSYAFNYLVYIDATKKIYIRIGGVFKEFGSATVVSIMNDTINWINICFVRSGDSIELFLNGSSMGSNVGYGTLVNTRFDAIGAKFSGASPTLGNIDEVCAFNRVATPSEIVTLSTAPTVDLSSLNPIAWYRNGDNGSYKSPQWLIPNNANKDKVSNYSLDFDGVDDRVSLTGTFDATNSLTLSCWVKSSGFVAPAYLCSNGGSGGVNSQFNLRFAGWGGLFSTFQGSSYYTNLTGFDDGNWHHIALTINYISGDVKFYKDSVISTTVLTWGSTYATAVLNCIGAVNNGGVYPMAGNIDEFSILQGALSQSEVTSLYNGGEPTTISGAISHWKMGEESTFLTNWTVPDSVGSNNGTSANMTIEDRIGEAPNSSNNAVSLNMDEVDRTTDVPT